MRDNIYTMTCEQLASYRTVCMELCYHYTSLANTYADQLKRTVDRQRELDSEGKKNSRI